jgi:Putative bacterial sensory transduction regulator
MKHKLLLAAGLTAAILAGPAMAQDAVRAEDPSSLTAFLFDEGIASKVDVDSYGDPMVQFRKGDRQYTIFFYNCTDNANCTNVQFYIGYETDGAVGTDLVNALNRENRFASAAIDDEDDVVFTMDVMTGDFGLSRDNFNQLLDAFVDAAAEFEDRVGWESE